MRELFKNANYFSLVVNGLQAVDLSYVLRGRCDEFGTEISENPESYGCCVFAIPVTRVIIMDFHSFCQQTPSKKVLK